MARKVIFDVDPGIDDATALCLALSDPRLDVVAITATGGSVSPQQATRNVQAFIEQLDPRRWPRIGAALAEFPPPLDERNLNGADGLGDNNFNVAELVHQHPAEKVISDEVRAAPGEVTIIALGPLTNIANVLQRDPEIASMIGHLIISGGTYAASGNISPVAEFNIYCNPIAARLVFRTPVTKTLAPLDLAMQVPITFDQMDQLKSARSRTGAFLERILPYAFRAYRQHLGMEGIYLPGVIATLMALQPELFETEPGVGDVETSGELTMGETVFDRRRAGRGRPNMDVAVSLDTVAVLDCIVRGLRSAP